MPIKPITGVRASPQWHWIFPTPPPNTSIVPAFVELADISPHTDAPKGPGAGSQHRWWYVKTVIAENLPGTRTMPTCSRTIHTDLRRIIHTESSANPIPFPYRSRHSIRLPMVVRLPHSPRPGKRSILRQARGSKGERSWR
jgi:hypothetical protein